MLTHFISSGAAQHFLKWSGRGQSQSTSQAGTRGLTYPRTPHAKCAHPGPPRRAPSPRRRAPGTPLRAARGPPPYLERGRSGAHGGVAGRIQTPGSGGAAAAHDGRSPAGRWDPDRGGRAAAPGPAARLLGQPGDAAGGAQSEPAGWPGRLGPRKPVPECRSAGPTAVLPRVSSRLRRPLLARPRLGWATGGQQGLEVGLHRGLQRERDSRSCPYIRDQWQPVVSVNSAGVRGAGACWHKGERAFI